MDFILNVFVTCDIFSSLAETSVLCLCLTGYRTVDALLQRMFEADLDPEDSAENDNAEAQQSGNLTNPSFSSA